MRTSERQTIGRFRVVRRIGRGSQGSVYLAKDANLERYVAIKVFHPDDPGLDSSDQQQSLLEGRILSRLRHPNIVSIYEAGEYNGFAFLVFEYVQGQTLSQLLEQHGALSIPRACVLIGPILDGIAAAHSQGVVHLDLSPQNILVDRDDVPRIMDFGLSRPAGDPPRDQTIVTGTLRYMAPEHFSNDYIGPYTDVLALGSTFYELVQGEPLMTGTSFAQVIDRITSGLVDLTKLLEQPLGERFKRFLEGSLERDFRARYSNGSDMREAFDLFLGDAHVDIRSAGAAGNSHSTVEFLLRRMRRKQDFPTISRTLIDINRLTNKGSGASADRLAKVILRDYAVTSKLLKLVNSAFYAGIASEVTSISRAVVILGFEQVRMIANSLTFFGHLKNGSEDVELKDSMTKSFLSGLIVKYLAERQNLPNVEEAFICGLFRNLGESLTIYYFPEDYREIRELMRTRSLPKSSASRGILGVTYEDLGAAVARNWKLPDSIVDVIRRLPHEDVRQPVKQADRLQDIAVFANELCEIAGSGDPENQNSLLSALVRRFEPSLSLSETFSFQLPSAGLERLTQYSHIFEINVDQSPFCSSVATWLEWVCAESTSRRRPNRVAEEPLPRPLRIQHKSTEDRES